MGERPRRSEQRSDERGHVERLMLVELLGAHPPLHHLAVPAEDGTGRRVEGTQLVQLGEPLVGCALSGVAAAGVLCDVADGEPDVALGGAALHEVGYVGRLPTVGEDDVELAAKAMVECGEGTHRRTVTDGRAKVSAQPV